MTTLSAPKIYQLNSTYKNYLVPTIGGEPITGTLQMTGKDIQVNTPLGVYKLDTKCRGKYLDRKHDSRIVIEGSAFLYFENKEIPPGTILVSPSAQKDPIEDNYAIFALVATPSVTVPYRFRKIIDQFTCRDVVYRLFQEGKITLEYIESVCKAEQPEHTFVNHAYCSGMITEKDIPGPVISWSEQTAEKTATMMKTDPPPLIQDHPVELPLLKPDQLRDDPPELWGRPLGWNPPLLTSL